MMVNNVRNNAQSASDECPPHYSLMDGKFEVRNLVEDRLRSLKHSTYKPNNPLIYSNYADAIEYLLRFHRKNGVEDLKKAQHVIQFMIDAYDMESELVLDELVKEKVIISDLAKSFEKDIEEDEMKKTTYFDKVAEDVRKAFESENEASFDKVSAEYYDTLYGFRAERGPF